MKSPRLRVKCGMFQMKVIKIQLVLFFIEWNQNFDISLKLGTTKFHFSEWFYVFFLVVRVVLSSLRSQSLQRTSVC